MLKLEIRPAEGEVFTVPVSDGPVVIGRSGQADITIDDRSLSRRHARLYQQGEQWMIEDLGSRNGTFVNGRCLDRPTELRAGDVVGVSRSLVTVLPEGPAPVRTEETSTLGAQSVFLSAETILGETRRLAATGETSDRAELERATQRLAMVNEVHEALSRSVEGDELLELILDRAFASLRPQHGAIFLQRDGEMKCVVARNEPGLTDDFPESTRLVAEVVGKGLAALVTDVASDARFADAESMLGAGVRTLVAAPLMTPDGPLGMIVLSSTHLDHQFSESDLQLFVPLASAAAMHLRSVGLAEEAAERRRWEREVALARYIQVALLPTDMPEFQGWQLYGGNIPSRGVSGDYFQIFPRRDGTECVVLIADVSGKGIGASLLTAYLDALCSSTLEGPVEPDASFTDISRLLHRRTPDDRFATAFLGILDVASGSLRYASAGHDPAALVRTDGGIEWLQPTGLPLGLLPSAEYRADETRLEPGDTLVLYTDGHTEATDPDEEEFGRERLAAVCRSHRDQTPDEIAAAVTEATDAFTEGAPYADDRTLVIVHRTG
jgi:serine phosphatase RsbU (regulator of sigma subunit)